MEKALLSRNLYERRENSDDARPRLDLMGGAPSACKSVSRSVDGRLRDWQTQARHQLVSPQETFASRNVVPRGEGETSGVYGKMMARRLGLPAPL